MNRRFEARKQAMLQECQVSPEVFAGMMKRLRMFAQPFIDCLYRSEQEEHAQTYLAGLLSDLHRKNMESIAYRHDQDRQGLQRFIGVSSWDDQALRMELARQVGEVIGEEDGVMVFDPSGFPKKGTESAGVQRQWLGRLGKVDNGQVGVYMGYATRQEHVLCDTRLFLPKSWSRDRTRRKKCGIPKGTRYRTRHKLALDMLAEQGDMLPHAWIAGDDEMGRSTQFRRDLRTLGEQYLLAVPSNSNIRDLEGRRPRWCGLGRKPRRDFERVDRWRASLAETRWTRIDVRDGEKGPLTVDIVKTSVVARTEQRHTGAVEELLVVIRSLDEDGKTKHDYYLSNAHPDTPLEELARVTKAAHRVEECIQRAKSEAGLADYEVRTWRGWYHHQTLSLIATWFLIQETRAGKKNTSDHRAADSPRPGVAVA